MDSILTLGVKDTKLTGFLKKMGYQILEVTGGSSPVKLISDNVVDLIILDSRSDEYGLDLVEFFRSQSSCKDVPIVFISDNPVHKQKLKEYHSKGLEFVSVPYKVGVLVSKLATLLRLRKMAGQDEQTASLGEINARLRDLVEHFEKELRDARTIQQSLIPKTLPKDARFEIAVCYDPLEEVGGDWYYVSTTPEGLLAVQIADVTGHGLSAAFIGSMTKLAMTAAKTTIPHELLGNMNALMAPNMPSGNFVTIFSYLYDPAAGRLQYARGGHTPGLLLHRQNQSVVQLLGDGFALAFLDDSDYSAEQDGLAVGDILVVFTDGISESANRSNEQYGYDRICEVLTKSSPDSGAETVLQTIRKDFETFIDGRLLKDDVTIIVLKRTQ